MTAAPHAVLEAARLQAEMSFEDLWMDYFALGGNAGPDVLRSYLDGGATGNDGEYDLVAQAINERFLDRGGDHPVPYLDELTERSS